MERNQDAGGVLVASGVLIAAGPEPEPGRSLTTAPTSAQNAPHKGQCAHREQ